jgi:hypothetical protein
MKAQELAGYFAKKIGKPIAYALDETEIGGSTLSPLRCPRRTFCTR